MSEEQNLMVEAAVPAPPRVKRQSKPKAGAASAGENAEASGQGVGERGGDAVEDAPKKAPRASRVSKKAVDGAVAVAAAAPGSDLLALEHRPRPAATESAAQESGRGAETHRSGSGEAGGEGGRNGSNSQSGASQGGGFMQGGGNSQGGASQGGGFTQGGGNSQSDGASFSGGSTGGEETGTSHGGDASGSTAGMSKSRRRRRKRKNRVAAANAAAAGTNVGAVDAAGDAGGGSDGATREFRQGAPNGSAPQSSGQNTQSGGQNVQGAAQSGGGQGQHAGQNSGGQNSFGQNAGQSQNSRRKKKKFRRAGEGESGGQNFQQGSGQGFTPRPPRPEPGNSLQGSTSGMGARRNRKPFGGQGGQNRGPRTFVGPMDHSYREVNGNFADGPASTIQVSNGSRHRNNGHRQFNEDRMPPELMHNKRPVVIPDDAPTHIYFFIEDLFFTAKIQEAAKQQGVKVAFMKPEKDVVAHLSELHDHEHPSLIVFDLNNANAKPLTLIPKLKAKLKKGTSILGFLSHLQGDLKQKAVEAGCHTVMPKSAFSQNLPNLLRRYGVEDEHEVNFNQ